MTMFCGYSLGALIDRGLKVGSNFSMQPDCFIDYSHCWLISIGDNVIFAPRVHVISHDASLLNHLGYTKIGRVIIGNKVFVGNNAMILPGVTIGDNVIVGAGSVVTKDIPENSVAAGNPARVISKLSDHLVKSRLDLINRPIFDKSWTFEENITDEMKQEMKDKLSRGIGFIKF